jgi:hypothetical protein
MLSMPFGADVDAFDGSARLDYRLGLKQWQVESGQLNWASAAGFFTRKYRGVECGSGIDS